MKIIGNSESVNQIVLTHDDLNVRSNYYMQSFPYCDDRSYANIPETIEIIFKDSHEIDDLIHMLEKFKKECFGYLG